MCSRGLNTRPDAQRSGKEEGGANGSQRLFDFVCFFVFFSSRGKHNVARTGLLACKFARSSPISNNLMDLLPGKRAHDFHQLWARGKTYARRERETRGQSRGAVRQEGENSH